MKILPKICQNLPKICQNLPKSAKICQNLPKSAKICRKSAGICRWKLSLFLSFFVFLVEKQKEKMLGSALRGFAAGARVAPIRSSSLLTNPRFVIYYYFIFSFFFFFSRMFISHSLFLPSFSFLPPPIVSSLPNLPLFSSRISFNLTPPRIRPLTNVSLRTLFPPLSTWVILLLLLLLLFSFFFFFFFFPFYCILHFPPIHSPLPFPPPSLSLYLSTGQKILHVKKEALSLLASEAMKDIAHLLRPGIFFTTTTTTTITTTTTTTMTPTK